MLDRNAHLGKTSTWGTSRAMTDVEALMWRAEADPRLRSDGVVLDVLDHAPDWDRLVTAHDWGTRLAPRLRQRVVEDALHLGPPAWVDTDLDLGFHLSRVRLAKGDSFEDVLELASVLHMAPFDPARPLWQAVLVEGLPDGRAAYLLKFHHSMADGAGAMQLFDLVHSDTAEPSPDKQAPPSAPVDGTSSIELTARRFEKLVRGSAGRAVRLARDLGLTAGRAVTNPQSVLSYVQSLSRVTKVPGTPSPLMGKRGLSRRLRTIEVPIADLRAAGKAAGGTLNDAYLAGLLGGLRAYHLQHGVEVDDIPMALPVSLRQGDHALGGNRFAGAYIAGPCGDLGPDVRIKLINERVLAARSEPALDFLGVTAPVTSRLPSHLLAGLSVAFAGAIDLQASNIPGLKRTAYLAGAKIEQMFVFGPVPGSAIMATLLSHEGICCIGIVTDNEAVPDPDVLVACIDASLREVLSLGAS
jgi:diacylglycerol O-acyltransferase